MEFDLENPLTSQENEFHLSLFSIESHHMPSINLLHCSLAHGTLLSFRREALSLVLQSCRNLDNSISYLAANYVDRYISKRHIPALGGKPWILKLLVETCVSLALKMKNMQRCRGFIFDSQTIQRMELVVLDALDWRVRSVTPFSFIDFFISLLKLECPQLRQDLKGRATELVFKSEKGIILLEFKPSVVAATVLLLASHELLPLQFPSLKISVLSCAYVDKEDVRRCFSDMQEVMEMQIFEESMLDDGPSTRTPLSVLEWRSNRSETESKDEGHSDKETEPLLESQNIRSRRR